MTVNEAIAVNAVMGYIVGMKLALVALGVSPDALGNMLDNVVLLADRAHKALGAGIDGAKVRECWNQTPAGEERSTS